MNETIIPKTRKEYKRVKFVVTLEKDLQEDEVICSHCHGTGLSISENVYGIKGDTTHVGIQFPFKRQSMLYCRCCNNGVLKKCTFCGKIISRFDRECKCEGAEEERRKEQIRKNNEKWEKAVKIPEAEAWGKYACLYVDNVGEFVFSAEEIEDLIEEYELDKSELRVYATEEHTLSADATNVVENACDDLHEEAYDNCDIEGLQKLIDEWCKNQTGTTSYSPDYKIRIILEASNETK